MSPAGAGEFVEDTEENYSAELKSRVHFVWEAVHIGRIEMQSPKTAEACTPEVGAS